MTWPVAERVRIQVRADILEGLWGDATPSAAQAVPGCSKPPAPPSPPRPSWAPQPRQEIVFDWVNMQFVVARDAAALHDRPPGRELGHGLLGPGGQPRPVPGGREARSRGDRRGVRQVRGSRRRTTASWTTGAGWAVGAVADAAGFRFGLLVAYLKDGSRTRFPAGDVSYLAGDVFAKGTLGPAKLQAEVVLRRRHGRPGRPGRPATSGGSAGMPACSCPSVRR